LRNPISLCPSNMPRTLNCAPRILPVVCGRPNPEESGKSDEARLSCNRRGYSREKKKVLDPVERKSMCLQRDAPLRPPVWGGNPICKKWTGSLSWRRLTGRAILSSLLYMYDPERCVGLQRVLQWDCLGFCFGPHSANPPICQFAVGYRVPATRANV
jgi:hypothetical protein